MRALKSGKPAICREFNLAEGAGTGYLVIDSMLGGGGTGGVRFGDDVTAEEVAALAREMSLKFAWLNIPRGGAKAGIRFPSTSDEERARVFDEFGRAIREYVADGRYIAGMDLGVGRSEYQAIMQGAGISVSAIGSENEIDSNYYTALTVLASIEAALSVSGSSLSEASVLVEGTGKVGRHLVQLLDRAGARIVGISTISGSAFDPDGLDAAKILDLADRYGDDCVAYLAGGQPGPSAELYRAEADVLVPGARVHAITAMAVPMLRTRYVVPMANAAATPDAEAAMHERGIVYLPGYVTNSGGIFCWYLANLSAETRDALLLSGLQRKVAALIREANDRNLPVSSVAREQAEARASRMRREREGSWSQRIIGIARKANPRRLPYLVTRRLPGKSWAGRNNLFLRWYFDARYFN